MRIVVLFCLLHLVFFVRAEQTSNDTLLIGYTRAAPFIIDDNNELEGISIWLWKKIRFHQRSHSEPRCHQV